MNRTGINLTLTVIALALLAACAAPLVRQQAGCPPDPPTPTPWAIQPTYTSRPTYTPLPPCATPTETCRPTYTPVVEPPPTPYPTATLYSTQVPCPGDTPAPDTPEPMPTSTPTATPTPVGQAYVVPDGVATVDGATNYAHVRPGDRLLVPSSRTGPIVFENLKGEEGKPVVIVNHGGKVKINATGHKRGIDIRGSEHFRLTGTGDPSVEYGFEVYGASRAGIQLHVGTRYYEIDHIHIHDLVGAGAGIRAVNQTFHVPGDWIHHDTRIHDCYIHDVVTECMYVGQGDGVTLKGVEVSYNRLERCGYDGIQVRDAVADVEVHHNYIDTCGFARVPTNNLDQAGGGLCIGQDTVGEWYNNMVINTRRGIQLLHPGDGVRIYNNIVVDSGQADQEEGGIRWFGGGSADIYNNTIVNSYDFGMKVKASAKVYDNIVASPTGIGIDGGDAYNNIESDTVETVGFVDPGKYDFHLLPSSPAVDAGSASGFAPFDHDGISRPQGAAADIGAYELEVTE